MKQQNSIETLDSHPSKKCFKSVLYISFVILFYQAISNTQLGIVSQFTHQNGQGWVGPLSTSLLFLGSGMGSIYNKYISRLHYRYVFFIGSLGYTLFIGLAVIFLKIGLTTAVQIIILVGSLISGVTVSMFYNGQMNYVNTCSQIDNQKTKYFGINMCIVQSANIVGNMISALLIEPVGQFNYALIMNISIFVISLFFFGVKDYKYLSRTDQNQPNNKYQDNQPYTLTQNQIINESTLIIPLKNQQMPLKIIFIFCFSGIMISFIYCQLSVIFYETFDQIYGKQELNRITFIAFMIEGVGEFLGGLSVVYGQEVITKKIGISFTFLIITFLFLISLVMVYLASYFRNLALLDFASFIAGYCDCMGFALGLSIAGRWQQKGITFFNIGQSITVAITSVMIAFIKFEYILIWCIFVYILSSYSVLSQRKIINQHQQKQDSLHLRNQ